MLIQHRFGIAFDLSDFRLVEIFTATLPIGNFCPVLIVLTPFQSLLGSLHFPAHISLRSEVAERVGFGGDKLGRSILEGIRRLFELVAFRDRGGLLIFQTVALLTQLLYGMALAFDDLLSFRRQLRELGLPLVRFVRVLFVIITVGCLISFLSTFILPGGSIAGVVGVISLGLNVSRRFLVSLRFVGIIVVILSSFFLRSKHGREGISIRSVFTAVVRRHVSSLIRGSRIEVFFFDCGFSSHSIKGASPRCCHEAPSHPACQSFHLP